MEKLKDIKKYIKPEVSNYHTDVPLDYLKDKLDRWINEYDLDMNPPYQRGYVWTDKQKKDYVEYIIRLGESHSLSGKQFYFNHPNWMGNWKTYENGCGFEIVDGKQRLNTIVEFINNEFPDKKGVYYNDFSSVSKRKFTDHQLFTYQEMNDTCTDEEVLEQFLLVNFAGVPQSEDHLQFVEKILKRN